MHSVNDSFRRHRHLIIFIISLIVVFWLLYFLRSVLLPFILGLVFAYLVLPAIKWVEKRLPRQGRLLQTKRVSLIILAFVVILGVVGFFSYFIVTSVVDAFVILVQNAPQFIAAALRTLEGWAEVFRQQFPPEMQQQINAVISEIGQTVGNAVKNVYMRGIALIPATFGLVMGFASLPVFLFYLLKDSEKLQNTFYSALSPWLAEHTRNIVLIIERVLGRYIRAQLMLGVFVAYLTLVGLLILRVQFAPALAAFAGATELIPILGPWIGGATAVIVTLAVAPQKAIWVAVLFFLVQILENNLLVPRIQGSYLHIHPVMIMVLLVLGAYLAGFWGIVLAVPLSATIVEIYKYVRQSAKVDETR